MRATTCPVSNAFINLLLDKEEVLYLHRIVERSLEQDQLETPEAITASSIHVHLTGAIENLVDTPPSDATTRSVLDWDFEDPVPPMMDDDYPYEDDDEEY